MARPVYKCPLCGQPVTFPQYQKILKILRKKELASEKQLRLVHERTEQKFEARLEKFKRQLRASSKLQLKQERERATEKVEKKYTRLKRTFKSILKSRDLKVSGLEDRIKELEKQLQRQTTPQMEGLLYEDKLLAELRKRFPEDGFKHTGKGGDILETVMHKTEKAGLIVYECKRYRTYSKKFVKQAFDAKTKRKADFALVVTNVMKKGTHGFFVERGVTVVHATGVLSLAGVVRTQIIQIAEMKLGRLQRDKAIKATLEYLEGPEFKNSLDKIITENISLYEDMMKEVREHVMRWKRQYGSYKTVHDEALMVKTKSKALLGGETEPAKFVPKETLPALAEMPEVEK